MADTNELIDVCTDLIRLVEGVGCKDWRDQNGQRFKDTNEWVRAYVAINNARKESREQAIHPADAALADDAIIELVTDYAQSKVRAESCQYHYESKEYDKEASETLEQIRAALRARAVPDDVAKDAARYRWLRDGNVTGKLSVGEMTEISDEGWERVTWLYDEELDAEIDAAMLADIKEGRK